MTPTSTFTWLDHNDEHQQRVREALAAFDSPDIVDPLGLGVVRDAFSDMLFPGVSTIQTRARYFVLVPWVYRRLIRDRVSSQQGDRRARDLEIAVTEALLRGSASHEGIIGRYARAAIKQLPSLVYWGGLGTWGIRRFDGTRHEYIASLDAFRDTRLARDGEVTPAHERSLWPGLPEEPPDLLETATLSLTTEEAEYLRDRAIRATQGSYLSLLLRDGTPSQHGDEPWTHPLALTAPPEAREQLRHARLFAHAVRGAELLYNDELFRLLRADGGEPGITDYASLVEAWAGRMEELRDDYQAWDRNGFWETVLRRNPRAGASRPFIDWWLDVATGAPDRVTTAADVRRRLAEREQRVKGARAKLTNRRARESSPAAHGGGLMSFRWPQAQRIILDIHEGLEPHA